MSLGGLLLVHGVTRGIRHSTKNSYSLQQLPLAQMCGHRVLHGTCWYRMPVLGGCLDASMCVCLHVHVCPTGDVLRDMGLRDAFNVQLSVPALNGDAVTTVLRSLDCFNSGEVLQVRLAVLCRCSTYVRPAWLAAAVALGQLLDTSTMQAGLGYMYTCIICIGDSVMDNCDASVPLPGC